MLPGKVGLPLLLEKVLVFSQKPRHNQKKVAIRSCDRLKHFALHKYFTLQVQQGTGVALCCLYFVAEYFAVGL